MKRVHNGPTQKTWCIELSNSTPIFPSRVDKSLEVMAFDRNKKGVKGKLDFNGARNMLKDHIKTSAKTQNIELDLRKNIKLKAIFIAFVKQTKEIAGFAFLTETSKSDEIMLDVLCTQTKFARRGIMQKVQTYIDGRGYKWICIPRVTAY